MATSILNLHAGGNKVTREELALIETPTPTRTHYPIPHHIVFDSVSEALTGAGYQIANTRLSVSHHGDRFFGTLDLSTEISDGVALAVGIRSSHDKSFPIGFCAGQRVFVCSNLAFTSEIVVTRKHTTHGKERYLAALATAVSSLPSYTASASASIARLKAWELTPDQAEAIILRSYEQGLIGARLLPELIAEYRNPSHDEFRGPMTGWKLWNCFTSALSKRFQSQPADAAITTIRLQRLINPEVIHGEVLNSSQAV